MASGEAFKVDASCDVGALDRQLEMSGLCFCGCVLRQPLH